MFGIAIFLGLSAINTAFAFSMNSGNNNSQNSNEFQPGAGFGNFGGNIPGYNSIPGYNYQTDSANKPPESQSITAPPSYELQAPSSQSKLVSPPSQTELDYNNIPPPIYKGANSQISENVKPEIGSTPPPSMPPINNNFGGMSNYPPIYNPPPTGYGYPPPGYVQPNMYGNNGYPYPPPMPYGRNFAAPAYGYGYPPAGYAPPPIAYPPGYNGYEYADSYNDPRYRNNRDGNNPFSGMPSPIKMMPNPMQMFGGNKD
jgi:hypothetical protein